jgi:DNA invertase Pin-like site-specific DNA recombinase
VTRVALYARFSDESQNPLSIADQLALCRRHAEAQGWQVVATFEDAALSGVGVEHRPGYKRLLAAACAVPRPFDVVLVESVDRITREMSETMRLHGRLLLRTVALVGVKDGIDSRKKSAKVELAVRGLVNELYIDDLAEKTHRGLTGSIERGLSAGGRVFGYQAVPVATETPGRSRHRPARIEVNPAEAPIVVRIFDEYARGRSLKTIVNRLNAEGGPVPREGHEAWARTPGLGGLDRSRDAPEREVRRSLGVEPAEVPERPGHEQAAPRRPTEGRVGRPGAAGAHGSGLSLPGG